MSNTREARVLAIGEFLTNLSQYGLSPREEVVPLRTLLQDRIFERADGVDAYGRDSTIVILAGESSTT